MLIFGGVLEVYIFHRTMIMGGRKNPRFLWGRRKLVIFHRRNKKSEGFSTLLGKTGDAGKLDVSGAKKNGTWRGDQICWYSYSNVWVNSWGMSLVIFALCGVVIHHEHCAFFVESFRGWKMLKPWNTPGNQQRKAEQKKLNEYSWPDRTCTQLLDFFVCFCWWISDVSVHSTMVNYH